jgi:hypothetical protein
MTSRLEDIDAKDRSIYLIDDDSDISTHDINENSKVLKNLIERLTNIQKMHKDNIQEDLIAIYNDVGKIIKIDNNSNDNIKNIINKNNDNNDNDNIDKGMNYNLDNNNIYVANDSESNESKLFKLNEQLQFLTAENLILQNNFASERQAFQEKYNEQVKINSSLVLKAEGLESNLKNEFVVTNNYKTDKIEEKDLLIANLTEKSSELQQQIYTKDTEFSDGIRNLQLVNDLEQVKKESDSKLNDSFKKITELNTLAEQQKIQIEDYKHQYHTVGIETLQKEIDFILNEDLEKKIKEDDKSILPYSEEVNKFINYYKLIYKFVIILLAYGTCFKAI